MKSGYCSAKLFDLEATLQSGQVFHWRMADGWWNGLIDATHCRIRQEGEKLIFSGASEELVRWYFALDHPLEEIYQTFPTDCYSRAALIQCRGLRIIRQPLWECLATFLFSALKQVAQIATISENLRSNFGEPVAGSEICRFPTAEKLAWVPLEQLRDCKLGFRARNLQATAQRIAGGDFDLSQLPDLATAKAREALCGLPGVGPKIANCVLLFSLGRLEAVPVDVWIARILRRMSRRKIAPRNLERTTLRRLGLHAGYVQQYLFHYARYHGVLPETA